MKQYVIFDLRGGLMSDNNVVTARSPIEAVRKFYKNVKRVKNGNFVSRGTGQHDSMIVVFNR